MSQKPHSIKRLGTKFCLPIGVTRSGIPLTITASKMSVIFWPNGYYCLEANLFLKRHVEGGKSLNGRGGTIYQYATQLNLFVQFCFNNKTCFNDLTNSVFTLFIKTLGPSNPKGKRSANTIIRIGNLVLDFLKFVGDLHNIQNFIGPECQIRAQKKRFRGNRKSSRFSRDIDVWFHASFPTPSEKRKGSPISKDLIKKLRRAAYESSSTRFLYHRRLTMILLFEVTGGRRAEVVNITVDAIKRARASRQGLLELITLKTGENKPPHRLVPVSHFELGLILQFIQGDRAILMKGINPSLVGGGFVLSGSKNGEGLSADYLTTEMSKLRNSAGIKEKAHPHMFRHRFITRTLVLLIQKHELQNKNNFRKALIDIEGFKRKLTEYTGHRNTASLETYIDIAFDEVSQVKNTELQVLDMKASQAMLDRMDQIIIELKQHENIGEAIREIESMKLLLERK